MNIESFFSNSLNFLNFKLNKKYKSVPELEIIIKIKINQCSARVWDNLNWNINKRCII